MLLVHVERVNQEVGKYGLPLGSVRFRRHAAVLTSSERAAAKPEVRLLRAEPAEGAEGAQENDVSTF